MARTRSHNSTPNRKRGKTGKKGSSSKYIFIAIAVCVLAGLGFLAYNLISPKDYKFERGHLDHYVGTFQGYESLSEEMSVYVDMSDGMNSAYASPESKTLLQNVINKLAANKGIKFFGLADQQIFPLEKTHTELYNYILNPASYDKQKAPIEKTLEEIIDKKQPALLMTDFEEYNGGIIQHAAYAKKYFIDWLEKGFFITFYKWDFVENGKTKKMFLAVFDDNSQRLISMIENAVELSNSSVDKFVLGGQGFNYPTAENYPSVKQGGNYHDKDGKDLVTNVMENGGADDYICYARTQADATHNNSQNYAPLSERAGFLGEYYPIGVSWKDAIKNASDFKQAGVSQDNKFSHLLSNLFIDFGAQNGYTISDIEVRTFDMQETMRAASIQISKKQNNAEELEKISKPEINMVLTASLIPSANLPAGWKEIAIDFDPKFDGNFVGGSPSSDLIRANVMISEVTANIAEATEFFGWDGNPSLANSVKETLTSKSCNPTGKILYTYFLKTIAE